MVSDREPLVVFVGRLENQKGVDILLSSLPGFMAPKLPAMPGGFASFAADDPFVQTALAGPGAMPYQPSGLMRKAIELLAEVQASDPWGRAGLASTSGVAGPHGTPHGMGHDSGSWHGQLWWCQRGDGFTSCPSDVVAEGAPGDDVPDASVRQDGRRASVHAPAGGGAGDGQGERGRRTRRD